MNQHLLPLQGGRSSAEAFMEEHDRLQQEVATLQRELRSNQDLLNEAMNMQALLRENLEEQRMLTDRETRRANMWLAHSMKLMAQDEAIEAILATRKRIAAEAAGDAARQDMPAPEPEQPVPPALEKPITSARELLATVGRN